MIGGANGKLQIRFGYQILIIPVLERLGDFRFFARSKPFGEQSGGVAQGLIEFTFIFAQSNFGRFCKKEVRLVVISYRRLVATSRIASHQQTSCKQPS